ncbi:hypothetical protein [Rhodococcus wratislaviensis]|uniref:Uncharacterized protein n=1 Tax=Rhodococcus wratislaviensis NBRC 100605 TaxID=1219028 RepID=X0QZZ7_RHOWR|nr:hypothetical protein RW1_012_00180 [Rhodococcus wratislaviensis NBRC 100605]
MVTVTTGTQIDEARDAPARPFEPDDRWVPVDRRWFGLDRATIAPALVVLAVASVMALILPAIDRAVPYEDTVAAGDVLEVNGDVTFSPATGWGITSGVRAGDRPVSGDYPDTATVVDGDVVFTVHTGEFDGDAEALLAQIADTTDALHGAQGFHVTGSPETIVTDTGDRGVIAGFSGTHSDGVIAAFVLDGRGVEVVATGPAEVSGDTTVTIARMITSIGHRTGEGS